MEVKAFSREIPVLRQEHLLIRLMKWGIGLFVIFSLLALIGIAGVLYYFSRDLPSINTLGSYTPSQATRIYSDENRVIGEYFIEKRVFVPISQMPKNLVQAILAVEDARFYEHKGFDSIRIVRAFLKNIESGRIRQGASTITQQLTRSLFLTPERTMERKVKELLLALKMEKMLSKDEILEIYLNHIYFGHGAYGVQIASKTYFGKNVTEISLEEAAFLAGLPKAPNDYSPYRHPEKAKFRQRIVLKRMVDEGYITQERYRTAYEKDLIFKKLHSGRDFARYFKEYVRQYLISRYGDDVVYKGGLNVYTSLNEEMQRIAEKALGEGLRQLDKRQGYRGPIGRYDGEEETKQVRKSALKAGDLLKARVLSRSFEYAKVEVAGIVGKILLEDMIWAARRLSGPDVRKNRTLIEDPKPADILNRDDIVLVRVKKIDDRQGEITFALEQEPEVEGAFISLDPSDGTVKAMVGGYDFAKSEFNRALMARRQPGSAFKPIIYGTAIDRGFTPATILIDNPVIFTDSDTNKVWKPENYEKKFFGPIALRDALTFSRNLATVKLLRQIGLGSVATFAKRIGIDSPLTRDLSLALGSSGVSLLELTSALGVYANEGVRVEPTFILSVTDSSGRVLESRDLTPTQVISKETAYVVTNILEDVIQRGTAKRARVIGRPVAGKTGTTNDFTDAWFVGYTPNLASGIWVGFDDNRSLGYRESGGRAALPIWVSYMEEALDLLPVIPFPIPDNIVYAKIDPATGLLAREGEGGEFEIFVKGTEPTEVKEVFASPSDFFRFDQEEGTF
ncbi:PBP1A family penicillin-binding protein [Nitrospira defluvii]|nr:PBP1A family penicillin-binding protein [Nitrospira defluvii]